MSSGKKQLLHSLQVFSESSHLLTAEQRWVLHPCSSTKPENKFLLSIIKLVLFLEECLLTVGERTGDKIAAYHTNVVSLFVWVHTALSSTLVWKCYSMVCHQLWCRNSPHGRRRVLTPCLYSTSHKSHCLQLELLTTSYNKCIGLI